MIWTASQTLQENKIWIYRKWQFSTLEKRILISTKLRQKVLTIEHQGHLGITNNKPLMRENAYWQGMDKEVQNFIHECIAG